MYIAKMLVAVVLLILGADWLVRGSSRLAARFGVSRLLIGLTVVAFGTSAPELAVSLGSALTGRTQLAVGNVVGSNIFNVLFVLGATALVTPIVVARQVVRLDLPILLAASLALYVLVADGRLGRLDGALLFGGCIAYTLFSVRLARAERGPGDSGESAAVGGTMGRDVVVIVAGLAVLLLGARWFVDGASEMARNFGVSELVIGLTIVAVGTSLPEVATSVVAAMRGEPDFVVGNVVGSNLMNILCILGTTSLVAPGGIEVPGPVEEFDLPIMIGAAFALLPLTLAGGRLGRRGGAFFLGVYVLYSTALFLRATESGALPTFRTVMLGFALPLVTGALIVIFVRGLLRRREEESRG